MTVHPGDKPVQRFLAYVVGFAVMFAFAVLAPLLLMSGSFLWPRLSAVDAIGSQRAEAARKSTEGQTARLTVTSVDAATKVVQVPVTWAMGAALPALQRKASVATSLVVPGSAAALQPAPVPAAKPAASPVPVPAANPVPAPASNPVPAPTVSAPQSATPAPATPVQPGGGKGAATVPAPKL